MGHIKTAAKGSRELNTSITIAKSFKTSVCDSLVYFSRIDFKEKTFL